MFGILSSIRSILGPDSASTPVADPDSILNDVESRPGIISIRENLVDWLRDFQVDGGSQNTTNTDASE